MRSAFFLFFKKPKNIRIIREYECRTTDDGDWMYVCTMAARVTVTWMQLGPFLGVCGKVQTEMPVFKSVRLLAFLVGDCPRTHLGSVG